MGWTKGKPRGRRNTKQVNVGSATCTQMETVIPTKLSEQKKRDPAKRALSEIQKVLAKLEKARAHVADLEQQVSRMSQSLAGAVQAKGNQMPAQLRELMDKTQEPEGNPGPLAGGDSMGQGRWL